MSVDRRILILTNYYGGLYSFRKEVVKALVDAGFGVTLAVPPANDAKEAYFREMGCETIPVRMERRGTNPLSDLALLRRYVKLIRSINPVAVLTYTIKPNVYGGIAARLCGVPQLANITGLGDAIENPGLLRRLTIAMYRVGLKKARVVFYQNISIQEVCRGNRIGGRGILLPGSGVNLGWHTLQEYPQEGGAMRFNFIGRVMKDKGVEEFFEMATLLKAKYPEAEFHIFGECEEHYERRLGELQERGVLVWHGPVPDVRPFMKDAYATVHPSYHEGMANVLLESDAAGRPVITSDINGCREAVDDGVTGFLCRAKDVRDLTDKVERFINLPYDDKVRMGLAARKKVEREFDRRLVVEAYMREIDGIK